MTQQRALMLGAKRTIAHGHQPNPVSLLFEFDDLLIATLPPVRDEDRMTVGRMPDCEVVVDDPSVSKHHATLRWSAQHDAVTLEDEGSSNGTFINGVATVGASAVTDGDDVAFGDARYCLLRTRTLHQRLTTGRFTAR
jgi:predicted component of type VI protein secretion system